MMLSIFTKRLCPLMSLAIAFGCGKKINDPKTTADNANCATCQTAELPSNITLQIDEAASASKSYLFPKLAYLKLPLALSVVQGSAIGKRVKIYYNVYKTGEYEFHCNYKSTTDATKLAWEKCEDSYGRDYITNAADLQVGNIPLDKDNSIKMQLTNSTGAGLKIEAKYQVDWK